MEIKIMDQIKIELDCGKDINVPTNDKKDICEKMMNLIGRLDLSYCGDREIYDLMMENENGQDGTDGTRTITDEKTEVKDDFR